MTHFWALVRDTLQFLVPVFFRSSKVVVTISDLASSLNKIQTLKHSQFVCVLTSQISQVPRKFHKTNSYFLSFSGLHSASALWCTLHFDPLWVSQLEIQQATHMSARSLSVSTVIVWESLGRSGCKGAQIMY